MNARRAQRGLNIIELMVAVALLVLLTMFALPMYRLWMQNSQLRASAESIMSALQFARAEAVRLNESQGVRFVLAGNDWQVLRVSNAELLRQGLGADLAPKAALVADPAPNTMVTFTALGRAVDAANAPITANFNVNHADTGEKCILDGGDMRCLRVQVRSGGLVRLCDPSVTTAGDPRLCLP